jgi:hypothetical protein
MLIPEYEEFTKVYEKYPSGNPLEGYNAVKYSIKNRQMPDGTLVTWDILKRKWIEYMNNCKLNGQKAQYIKKMSKWCDDQDYLASVSSPDNYIAKLKELYRID